MKNTLLLVLGIVLSLLFLFFPSWIYEIGYFQNEFSNEMYNEGLYFTVALITVSVAWIASATYYYVINSVSFSRWYHWAIMLFSASIISSVVAYICCDRLFTQMGYDFSYQLRSFCLVDFVISILIFIISSFSIRWWSSNCRHTPFPE